MLAAILGARVEFAFASSFERPFELPWFLFAGAFALTERFPVDLEVRREAHTLSFTEIVVAIGLVFANPAHLVMSRVGASVAVLVLYRRTANVKVIFNSGGFAFDVGVSLLLYEVLLGNSSPVEPAGWVAALVAIGVAHGLGAIAVSTAMRLAGAPVTIRTQTVVGAVSLSAALAGTAVALGAASVLWADRDAWILLALIAAALGYFFVSFVRIRERHRDLGNLHTFTTGLPQNEWTSSLPEAAARGLLDLLNTERAILLLPVGDSVTRVEATLDGVSVDRIHLPMALDASVIWPSGVGGPSVTSTIAGIEMWTQDVLAAPLPLSDGAGLVVVDGRRTNVRAFDAEDFRLLETAAGHLASAFHNSQLVDRLRHEAAVRSHQALHDDVTDLPNQRALIEHVNGQLVTDSALAMITVRVNSLREVNETLGRTIGDEMLRQVAVRLQPVSPDTWCARSATDEFTLIVPGGQAAAEEFSGRIVEAFELPVLCGDVALAVIVGIGVALSPDHGADADNLLRRASLAASRTALDGTTVTTWAADRDPYDPQRLSIAADLRDAIPGGELEVHFQPQLDVGSGLVTGAEALVRWQHPRLGQLRPDQFIPAAENTGAIDALTLHVLTVAAMAGVRWRERGWDLDIAVNLSARNLTNPNFASDVATILDRTGLPARSLTMELTESSVMTEAERALRTLSELDDLGIAISIDDFGTGYSSLAHLRRLPVGEIKIDKSFVFELTTSESDEAIVRSMIDLGHNLGLTVVVEGVETVEVRDRLHELGTDRLQGYLLSRPLPIEAFEYWVSERPTRMLIGMPADRVVQLQQHRAQTRGQG